MKINSVNTVSLGDVLEYEQPTKYIVDNTNYDNQFEIPVLTAGKSFLLGYTNETHNVFRNVPVIIFDDFTTAFKYVDFPFKVKSSAMKILKANKEIADIRFLYYRMMKTGIDTELHKRYWISKYSKVKIPLPPLDQQKKIAAILDAAYAYREKTKALITKYDELTQSLFLDMFGDPVTNPKGWDKIKLGELHEISSGGTPSRKINDYYENGTIPWVKTGDLKGLYVLNPSESITEEALKNSSAKLFPSDTLLIAMYGATIGACSILNFNAATNQACAALLPSDKVNILFEFFFFREFKKELIKMGVGGAQPNISAGLLKNLKIYYPPMDHQNQFAERVKAIESQKAQAQDSLAGAEDLFNSLLQRAFKGELV